MKVYLTPPQPSRGLQRIADALTRYAPSNIEIVQKQADANLVIIYAIGRREAILKEVSAYRRSDKQYSIIQVCLRSTMSPSTSDWFDIWHYAKAVWSYYDLNRLIYEDGNNWKLWTDNHFYHAPLGVDSEAFWPRPLFPPDLRDFTILTSGKSRLSESVRECWLAAVKLGRLTAHVGADGEMRSCNSNFLNQTDEQLAWIYSQCQFVSGLRRKEGFELPAAEGLLCGARPILFDTPDYRWNYKHWGEYIQETDRQGVVDQLVELFKRGARPVTQEERAEAAEWFNWETICKGFYDRCL